MKEKVKVGIDFGTTNSIISYWDKDQPRFYQFDSSAPYVPTAVAYSSTNQIQTIGIDAIDYWKHHHDQTELYRFFKTLLPINKGLWKAHGWNYEKTPEEVAADFLEQLLLKAEGSFYQNMDQPEIDLVVSIPQNWQNDPRNPGADKLKRILENMGLHIKQLISEPLAAAGYYIWKKKASLDKPFNLLVCDMGGGTFDVSYCKVNNNKLRVHGKGSKDDKAGVYYLKTLLKEIYHREGLYDYDETSHAFQVDLWELDKQFKLNTKKDKIEKEYAKYLQNPVKFNYPLFYLVSQTQKKFEIRPQDIFEAFESVEDGIIKVLTELEQAHGPLDFEQILFVGGFSQYFQVRTAVLNYFKLKPNDEKVQVFNRHDRLFAIAYGASLFAADKIEIQEYYNHRIDFFGWRRKGKEKIDVPIPIIASGDYFVPNQTEWAEEKVLIDAQSFTLHGNLYQNGDTEKPIPWNKSIVLDFHPKEKKEYHIGVEIDQANRANLVIKDEAINKRHITFLGDILSQDED